MRATRRLLGYAEARKALNPDLRVEAIPHSHFRYVPTREGLLQNRSRDGNDTYVLQT